MLMTLPIFVSPVWLLDVCLDTEVSLDLNAYRIVLCMIAVQSGVLGLYILVLPSFHEGCIQQWSGNGKCIFRNKIEKFCCNFNFY